MTDDLPERRDGGERSTLSRLAFFSRFATHFGYRDIGPSSTPNTPAYEGDDRRSDQWPVVFVSAYFGPDPRHALGEEWWKGDFNEEAHPRQPKGIPEGGEFKDKNSATADETADGLINQNTVLKDIGYKAARKVARQRLRATFVAGLRTIAGLAADVVPYAGEAFDVYEIAQTVADFKEIAQEAQAAAEYVEGGPRTLEDLRASQDERGFSSAAAFKKNDFQKFYGPAGDGYDYHHIVWQGGPNGTNIPPELLHSTENMVRVPRLLHEAITAAYNEPSRVAGLTERQWLDTQPYDVQRAEGIRIMRRLGIIQ